MHSPPSEARQNNLSLEFHNWRLFSGFMKIYYRRGMIVGNKASFIDRSNDGK